MPGIIPRPRSKAPSWTRISLILSLIILGVSLLGFFAINWAEKSARENIAFIQQDINDLATPQNENLEKEAKIAQQQTSSFSDLLQSHQHSSAFLDLMKKVIHPGIVLDEFTLNADQAQAHLKGRASSFQAMGEQILALRKGAEIKLVTLTDLSLNEDDQVNFLLDLELTPQLFK